jgi:predicted aspartyl protease
MSQSYDAKYDPSIPVLQVAFGYQDRPRVGTYQAIVDTGADATIVTEEIVRRLKATPLNPGQLVTQWGDAHPVTIYLLDIQIDDLLLPGIVVAGDPKSHEIILGRNVLNKLALFLDGSSQQTDLLDDATVKQLRARRK